MPTTSSKNINKVFIDIDICLDLLLQREPHFEWAARVFTLANEKRISAAVSSLTFAHLNFLLKKVNHSQQKTIQILSDFKLLTPVLAVDDKIISAALASGFSDLEDAIQYYSAVSANVDFIITRNKKHYKKSAIPVVSAEEYLSLIN